MKNVYNATVSVQEIHVFEHKQINIYGTVSSKIMLLGSFFKFSVNCKEPLSNGPYASKIGLSIIKL